MCFLECNYYVHCNKYLQHTCKTLHVCSAVHIAGNVQQHVPATATFDVGCFEGKWQSKIWLVTSDDLDRLYELRPKGGEVLLWCEGMSETGSGSAGKRSKEADCAVSKRYSARS